jgi:hypothetical protein
MRSINLVWIVSKLWFAPCFERPSRALRPSSKRASAKQASPQSRDAAAIARSHPPEPTSVARPGLIVTPRRISALFNL